MNPSDQHDPGYVVPSYRATDDASWYHFLHGNVPGHQIDFMYRPEVPQGNLTRQHFSHLARLMKYIEPQANAPHAFAIGNLSRDDTQHEPGHGAMALVFGLRIRGVTDHAGRRDPPFAHAIAAVDREVDPAALLAATLAFHSRVLGAAESAEWYRAYVRCATETPSEVPDVLAQYVASFSDLTALGESSTGMKWTLGDAAPPKRIVLVHDDDTSFEVIARNAARIAAVLYASDIRWTVISSGREADLPGGVSIRLLGRSDVGPGDAASAVRRLEELPQHEDEIARDLFGATRVGSDNRARPACGPRWSGDAPLDRRSSPPGPQAPSRVQHSAFPPPAPSAEAPDLDVEIDVSRFDAPPPAPQPAAVAKEEPVVDFRRSSSPRERWIVLAAVAVCASLGALHLFLSAPTVEPPPVPIPVPLAASAIVPIEVPAPSATAAPLPSAAASARPAPPPVRRIGGSDKPAKRLPGWNLDGPLNLHK